MQLIDRKLLPVGLSNNPSYSEYIFINIDSSKVLIYLIIRNINMLTDLSVLF